MQKLVGRDFPAEAKWPPPKLPELPVHRAHKNLQVRMSESNIQRKEKDPSMKQKVCSRRRMRAAVQHVAARSTVSEPAAKTSAMDVAMSSM